MNQDLIPTSLHWMIPIVVDLADQRLRDVKTFTLREEHKELINRRLTATLRKEIELWIGLTDSEEAGNFLVSMITLDELGLLQQSEPILNYEYWYSELASQLWGHVRGAVRLISKDFLSDLSEKKLSELNAYVEKILKSATNTNSRIWLTWLRCQIDKKLDIGRDFLRKVVDDSPLDNDEELDLGEDACCALISMPNISEQDIDSVIRFILRTDIDEFKAAVALEALLSSNFVTSEKKLAVKQLARKTNCEELHNVVDSYEMQG